MISHAGNDKSIELLIVLLAIKSYANVHLEVLFSSGQILNVQ